MSRNRRTIYIKSIKGLGYITKFLHIKTKDSKIVNFKLNVSQIKLYNIIKELSEQGKPIRIIILKARQMGFSTLVEGLIFQRTTNKKLVNSLIVAHKEESTNNLFNMSKLFYEMLPNQLKPMRKASNSKELIFENPTKDPAEKKNNPGLRSKIKCATAGGEGVGRSDTLQNVHISEYAFWTGDKKNTLNGIMQSVPNNKNTMVIIESTPNGFEHFKELWDMAVSGESDFKAVFFPWFEHPEYRMPASYMILDEEEKNLVKNYNVDMDQLTWRRWCIKNNCSNDLNLFHQEYPANPQECFIATGSPCFDVQKIINRIAELRKNKIGRKGYLKDVKGIIKFVYDDKGSITLFKDPEPDKPYVLGADVSEGTINGDYDAVQVLDNITLEQVAVLHYKYDVDTYAEELVKLGKFFNYGLLAPEVNFNPGIVINLERLNYSKIYVRQHLDSMTKKVTDVLGWRTDKISRPIAITDLIEYVRDHTDLINDLDTLYEMLSFIKNDRGRPEAMQGKNDDLVLAYSIALSAQYQQSKQIEKNSFDISKLPPDLKDDYYNAKPEIRAYLLKKWGVVK